MEVPTVKDVMTQSIELLPKGKVISVFVDEVNKVVHFESTCKECEGGIPFDEVEDKYSFDGYTIKNNLLLRQKEHDSHTSPDYYESIKEKATTFDSLNITFDEMESPCGGCCGGCGGCCSELEV